MTWICGTCGTVNEGVTSTCSVCGFSRSRPTESGPLTDPTVPVYRATPDPTRSVSPNQPGGSVGPGYYPAADGGVSPPPRNRRNLPLIIAVAFGVTALLVAAVLGTVLIMNRGNNDGHDRAGSTDRGLTSETDPPSEERLGSDIAAQSETITIPPSTEPTSTPASGPVRLHVQDARASTVLPSTRNITYGPENMLDDNLDTAWNHAGSAGAKVSPVGSWVELDFAPGTDVSYIEIINGYVKGDRFNENFRIGELRLTDSSGHETIVQLSDITTWQPIRLDWKDVGTLRLHVNSTYGTKNDVAITEIRAFGKP